MRFWLCVLTLVGCAAASTGVFAEEKKGQEKPAAPAKQEMKMQTADLIVLIKSTIMALQHANQTGNYSVLRDMGSPIFRERFDQAALTAVFSNLRSRGVNLVPVLFLAPNLSKQPEMLAGNELQLVGNFATQPLQIQYDMRFLFLDGVWRLNALSVDAVPVQQPVASAAPQVQNAAPQVQSAAAAAPGGQAAKPSNASAGSKGKKVAQPASQ